MGGATPYVVLGVQEAAEFDVGLGRARLDTKTRQALGIEAGGVVEIVGKRGTAAKLSRPLKEDEGRGIIRVDGLVRRNLGVSVGDEVHIRKAQVLQAERVTFAPIISEGHKISFGQGIENFVKHGLLKRPVMKGDVVIVPGIALMGGALPFMVIKVVPKGIVQIVDDSIIEMKEEPVREGDLLRGSSSEEIHARFVTALKQRMDSVLKDFEDTIAETTGEPGEKARELAKAIRKLLDDAESRA
jgi:transitional endoplasmic reticulum ATPase